MKLLTHLLPVLTLCSVQFCVQTPAQAAPLSQEPAPAAGKVAADLFWVADSRKMDEFLAQVELPDANGAVSYRGVLPDTRTAWREYAMEARGLAQVGRTAESAGRLSQMFKLAAVYRACGGLENVVQSEEIRHLAGLMAAELGSDVTRRIKSPYLEKSAGECVAQLGKRVGDDFSQTSAAFRRNLTARALETHARLARAGCLALAAKP